VSDMDGGRDITIEDEVMADDETIPISGVKMS
jgi:hypothetical protein